MWASFFEERKLFLFTIEWKNRVLPRDIYRLNNHEISDADLLEAFVYNIYWWLLVVIIIIRRKKKYSIWRKKKKKERKKLLLLKKYQIAHCFCF